ncbi:MAG: methylenetetrahydrofolate--tRNA-(uracil(54)-C(5))-methyltransferase (FADH(2)-oxidizing) TrmFO [Sphingomonadales bacterium]
MIKKIIHIVGGGLAGSEAAWQIAEAGLKVKLYEMRPTRRTDAHQGESLAELVCSNSFRSDDAENNAVGLLHREMRTLNSIIMMAADLHKVPAGSALAVDREDFSATVTSKLKAHPNVEISREEITGLPPKDWGNCIIATGPLTAPKLSEAIQKETGVDALCFFDAIAPIIHKDSIDFDKVWFQSRYDKGETADYINCPMLQQPYYDFVEALNLGEKSEFKDWEADTPYFEGCMPIEVMAERGNNTLRFGPMKPVGLTNPHVSKDDFQPWAVVQLRQDNKLGTLYNMVGFQTKLKYAEQVRIFKTIPGLENAEFARLGGLHRNTFINSPKLLDEQLRLKSSPNIRFAGQITGVEGYVESSAIGLMAGRMAAAEAIGNNLSPPPNTTAFGALIHHITGGHLESIGGKNTFQPMNINFGLFPPLPIPAGEKRINKKDRKPMMSARANGAMKEWLSYHT